MDIQEKCVNALRFLSIDSINKAKSGHPGICLGAANIVHTLFTDFLKATPKDSKWLGRDRFILAAGHGSALLYSVLHVSGYKIGIEDLKNFRQLDSLTPGHPEVQITDGVDCTSGPLGQGITHALGFAIAERKMGELFNKEDIKLFDNYTYVLCGDGDMEEGVTQEAISLAGTLKLNKLIVLYDANNITLDGNLNLSFVEDVKKRFEACAWRVYEADGLDKESVAKALKKAQKVQDKPTLIICKTIIGYGASKEDTCLVHGSPIGEEETSKMRQKFGWNYPPFEVPDEVYKYYEETFKKRGDNELRKYKRKLKKYALEYPNDYQLLKEALNGDIYKRITYPSYEVGYDEATRVTSGKIINAISSYVPTIFGGASDVARSVNTEIKDGGIFGFDKNGRNIYFGIREFAMSCAQTGILLYGGLRPYIGCFLVFSDYLKASIRTAAIMGVPSINLFTHDSIAVGEDGPTHQPIEQTSSLRLIPDTVSFRPAGALETSFAFKYAIENKKGPVNIILSRQNILTTAKVDYKDFIRGAYVVKDVAKPDKILIATGSEVPLAIDIANKAEERGLKFKVVSLTSFELFNKQSKAYRKRILNSRREKIIAIEMGSSYLWYQYASVVFGIDTFGKSAKSSDVIEDYGFTAEKLLNKILNKK